MSFDLRIFSENGEKVRGKLDHKEKERVSRGREKSECESSNCKPRASTVSIYRIHKQQILQLDWAQ